MKVLWVTSQILPQVAEELGYKKSNFGGWVNTMLNQLKTVENMELGIVMCADVKDIVIKDIDKIRYYIIPMVGKNKDVSTEACESVIDEFKPDIMHIEGNEFSIQNKFAKIKTVKNVVSLQGILSGYEQYQCFLKSLRNSAHLG